MKRQKKNKYRTKVKTWIPIFRWVECSECGEEIRYAPVWKIIDWKFWQQDAPKKIESFMCLDCCLTADYAEEKYKDIQKKKLLTPPGS